MRSFQNYRPVPYFVSVMVLTFILWSIGGYLSFGPNPDGSYMIWMLLGLMIPFLVAVWMIWRFGTPLMRREFLQKLFNLRLISFRMIPFVLLAMPASVVIAIAISLQFGEPVEQFRFSESFSFSVGFVPVLLLFILAAVFEELGWRGYGFESLQDRFSFLNASIIFGALWSFWHLPLLWVNGSYQYEIFHQNLWFAVNFFVSTMIMGVIVSWVCFKNRKSILAAIVFHFIINLSQEALEMTQTSKCIQTFVLLFFVVVLVWRERDLFFATPSEGKL